MFSGVLLLLYDKGAARKAEVNQARVLIAFGGNHTWAV